MSHMLIGEEAEAAVSYDVFRSICGNQVVLVIYCVMTPKLGSLKKYLLSLLLPEGWDFR